eukprot:scaffold5224_cov135-Amphora_coffeaeformis.AAC.1
MKQPNSLLLVSCLMWLACSSTLAFAPCPDGLPPTKTCARKNRSSSSSSSQLSLYDSVEAAIADAQRICAADPASNECRVAWDIVEELEAADSHKSPVAGAATTPGELDGTAMMGSMDILLAKIDGKMDQLFATADQFQHVDPVTMDELGLAAQQMKQAIANARMNWNMPPPPP